MKTPWNHIIWTSLALAGFTLTSYGQGGTAGLELSSLERIARARVFPQPFVWVGDMEASEHDSLSLAARLKTLDEADAPGTIAAMEQFVLEEPRSAWAPSIHFGLGQYCLEHGAYSPALFHWEAAWNGARGSITDKGRELAVNAAAKLACLLGNLGEKDRLETLLDELEQQQLPLRWHGTSIAASRAQLVSLKSRPGDSYRCGFFALEELARALNQDGQIKRRMLQVQAPEGGFSLAQLLDLAETNGILVQAVRRPAGVDWVVPCVIHLKLNHYATVLAKEGTRFVVADPTFGRRLWVEQEVLERECSGNFLVSSKQVPANWVKLTRAECSEVVGRGYPDSINDPADSPPAECGEDEEDDSSCEPPTPNDGAGDGNLPPPRCCALSGPDTGDVDQPPDYLPNENQDSNGLRSAGMPQWRVSEPFINLWLHDTPLRYRLSNGRWMSLKLNYKQRGENLGDLLGGFGPKWSCNWLAMLQSDSTKVTNNVINHKPGGGVSLFTSGSVTPEYKSGAVVLRAGLNLVYLPYWGAWTFYELQQRFVVGVTNHLPTRRFDKYGRGEVFSYEVVNDTLVRLKRLVDKDGRTNTLAYDNPSFPQLITGVTNVYGQTAQFRYDNWGRLTNITDMAGMSSSFQYDSSDNITNMTTLYGTTSFQSYEGLNPTYSSQNRALLVNEASGDHQLYVFSGTGPTGVAHDGLPNYRNSFHWNRAQYAAISSQGKTNYILMPDADYQLASTKHWLHGPDRQNLTVSDTLGAMGGPVDPNWSGRTEITMFAYQGQTSPPYEGTLKRVTEISYLDGLTMEITRNDRGRPLVITYHKAGLTSSYTNLYDASGINLLKEIGPRGELVRGYGYHPIITNLLTSVTNALGEVIRYTHDTNTMKVTSITFPSGLVRTNIYYEDGPSKGFLRTQIDIGVRTNSYSYLNGDVYVHTNALGLVVTNFWDSLHRWVGRAYPEYPDSTTVSNVYSKLDIVATKDRLGYWTYYGYDAVRQLTVVTNAKSQVTRYDYCGCGSPSLIIRSNGAKPFYTQFQYDTAGRLTNTIYPDGYWISRSHDYRGLVDVIRDSGGLQLSFSYTILGLRYGVEFANLGDQTVMQRGYDEYGRITNSINQNGVSFAQTYDLLSRVLTRQIIGWNQQAKGGMERFVYNERGLTNYTDMSGGVTTFVRDAAGRTLFKTNANLERLRYTYNPEDKLLTLIDGNDHATAWNYNEYGLVTNKVDANGADVFRYQYDAAGRLTNRWTPEKGNTGYGYDPLGNLTSVRYPRLTNTYAYDSLNRLTNATDATGPTGFSWTDGNQLASENGPRDSDTVSFAYTHRQRTGLSVLRPNAATWTQSYGYDDYGHLSSTTSGAGSFTYHYTAFDLIDAIYYPSGGGSGRSYDDLGRLTGIGFGGLDEHGYSYNSAFQRTQQVFNVNNYIDYTYDKIGQLQSAKGWEADGLTPRLHEQFGYGYDAAWNLSSRTNNGLVQTFAVNNLNELTDASRTGTLTVAGSVGEGTAPFSVTVSGTGLSSNAAAVYGDGTWARAGASPSDGPNSYTATATDSAMHSSQETVTVNMPLSVSYHYDANGNLTNDGLRSFEYDWENQLTNVFVPGQWRSEFVYDALMRRRVRKEFTWSGSSWVKTNEVRYIYDGRVVVQERDANNLPLVTFTRGLDLSERLQDAGGIGGLLARTDHSTADGQGAHAYYHSDGNGNVTCLLNGENAVVARYSYDPFGNLLAMTGPLAEANLYRFSSKEVHRNSGLVYYLYRFYHPVLQRWLNRDPLEESGGINLSAFVSNDPINLLDFFGLTDFYPSDFIGPIPSGGVRCPEAPKGVSLYQNTTTAESLGFNAPSAPSRREEGGFGLGTSVPKALWFYNQVKSGGPWDFKLQDPKYEDFGNFHYGATGSAYGFSDWELQNEAGIAQQKDPRTRGAGRGIPGSRWKSGSGVPPYGDEPKDNEWIKYGIEYNKKYPASKGAGPCG